MLFLFLFFFFVLLFGFRVDVRLYQKIASILRERERNSNFESKQRYQSAFDVAQTKRFYYVFITLFSCNSKLYNGLREGFIISCLSRMDSGGVYLFANEKNFFVSFSKFGKILPKKLAWIRIITAEYIGQRIWYKEPFFAACSVTTTKYVVYWFLIQLYLCVFHTIIRKIRKFFHNSI